ncbi:MULTISPECIES: hypothetical protein [Streptomyces]|uniref:Carbohydrate kinase PfkB domain-containing protein n=2 Tax=Streptomyces TaxID=1883 RepID=A0ABV9IEM0_9ACTN
MPPRGLRPEHLAALPDGGALPPGAALHGAGDAFTAATLAHLHRTGRLGREGVDGLDGGEIARLLSYAVEIAADTCTRAGAQPPYRSDGVPAPA